MTRGGIYGSDIEADNWEDADAEAHKLGYNVLDWADPDILVIADESGADVR